MKIAVIGAGIIGMCTAYELVQDGHEVIVFERNASVAQEASFACGGYASPSLLHPHAFASPLPNAWLRQLTQPSGIEFQKGLAWSDVRWLYQWKTGSKGLAERLATAHSLATYSKERLSALALRESLAFEQSQGHMLLWRSESALNRYQNHLAALKECGMTGQALTPDQARAMEPALQGDHAFHSATYFAADEVGNCRQLAHLLKVKLVETGAQLRFNAAVRAIDSTQGLRVHLLTGAFEPVDHVVVCANVGAGPLCMTDKPLPLTTLWSHSLSAPIREPLNAPRSAVQDMHTRISVSRMGMRIRVSGGAALGAKGPGTNASTVKQLYRTLSSLFPGAVDLSRSAQVWRGASQFTPDGLPLIGQGFAPGCWLNVGHGHNGWAMAAGSARLVADMILGKQTALDATKLRVSRFQS